MTFFLASNGGNCVGCEWVAAQGEITPDTPEVFRQFIELSGSPYRLVFHSPGGNLIAGIQLGEMIRQTGATTMIGETVRMEAQYGESETTIPGVCASACTFAFIGGTERFVSDDDRLGVHQFYSSDDATMDSEVVQALVGFSLIHTLQMGVDAGVIVAASGTSPNEIHWFNREELVLFGLDTSGSFVEPWVLEPYRAGTVLTTRLHTSTRRSVAVTLFCRTQPNRWHLLLTEEDSSGAMQLTTGDFFQFSGAYPSSPTIVLGDQTVRVKGDDIDFQRIVGDEVLLSILLPNTLPSFAGQTLSFDPDFARVFNNLLSATVVLPPAEWLNVTQRNCL